MSQAVPSGTEIAHHHGDSDGPVDASVASPSGGRAKLLIEMVAAIGAIGLAVLVTGMVMAAHPAFFFADGDSVLLPIVGNSLVHGGPQDWAMSAVLFIPETVVYLGLRLLGLSVSGTLAVNGMLNVVLLYACLRVVGVAARNRGPWPALAAFVVYLILCLAELHAYPLAGELALTTYYSATTLAVVLSIGLSALWLRAPRSWVGAVYVLTAVISTMSNPLFVVWFAGPAVVGMVALGIRRRRWAFAVAGATAGAVILGLLLRPLVPAQTPSGEHYFHPRQAPATIASFGNFFLRRMSFLTGLQLAIVLLCFTGVLVALVSAWRRKDEETILLSGVVVTSAAGAICAAVLSGIYAPRYLQPAFFLAPLVVLLMRRPRWWSIGPVGVGPAVRVTASSTAVVIAVAVAVAGGRTARSAVRSVEASTQCAVDWVNASGRVGAGQYWSVRAIKARIDDQADLLQLQPDRTPLAWLVNLHDYRRNSVSYLVTTSQSERWQLPGGLARPTRIRCGQYTIVDYGSDTIPVVPSR